MTIQPNAGVRKTKVTIHKKKRVTIHRKTRVTIPSGPSPMDLVKVDHPYMGLVRLPFPQELGRKG